MTDSSRWPEAPPLLSDARIRLRPLRASDVDVITDTCRRPEVAQYTTVPQPYERGHAEQFVAQHDGSSWGARGPRRAGEPDTGLLHAVFAIVELGDSDDWLANIGLHDIDLDLGRAEVGYLSGVAGRGRGLVTRAVILLSRWAIRDLGLRRIDWYAVVGNDASLRVAQRAGFTLEGTQRLGLAHRGALTDSWVAGLVAQDVIDLGPEPEIAAGPLHLLPAARRPPGAAAAWAVHESTGGAVVGQVSVYDAPDGAFEVISTPGGDAAVSSVANYLVTGRGFAVVDASA